MGGKMDYLRQQDGTPSHFLKANHSPWKGKKARLYLCGLGLYEAYFTDGEKTETDILKSAKIGEEYLTPYCNNYNQWLQYQTYDVTAQMQREACVVRSFGEWVVQRRFGLNQTEQKGFYGDEWKLLVEVHLEYEDGTQEIIGTDDTWEVTRSNLFFPIYMTGRNGMIPWNLSNLSARSLRRRRRGD